MSAYANLYWRAYVYLEVHAYENLYWGAYVYLEVQAKYGEQTKDLHLFVVTGNGPTLLGRSWLVHLCLDWATIAKTATYDAPRSLSSLIMNHAAVFTNELSMILPFKAKLRIRLDAVLSPDQCCMLPSKPSKMD